MPKIVTLILFCCALSWSGLLLTQEKSDEQLRQQYQEKIKKEFAKKISWQRSLEKAAKKAKKQKKPIFGYFSRSYAT